MVTGPSDQMHTMIIPGVYCSSKVMVMISALLHVTWGNNFQKISLTCETAVAYAVKIAKAGYIYISPVSQIYSFTISCHSINIGIPDVKPDFW